MENEQGLLSGLVSEYDLGDLSEEEEEGEDLHRTDEDQDAGTQEGDDQFGADAEEALLRAQVTTSHFTTPLGRTPAQNELGFTATGDATIMQKCPWRCLDACLAVHINGPYVW